MQSLSKSQQAFFFLNNLILKIHMNCEGPRLVKTTWKKKYKVGGLKRPGFKYYDTATVSNTVDGGVRQVDQ